jgi:CDP-4-dehydro-6-deoxyglucose reductase
MPEPLLTTLAQRTPIADGVVDFRFALRTPSSLVFRAGQFVTLTVGKDAAGRDLRRSYSLASTSPATSLRLLLRLVPGGLGSHFFDQLTIGDEVNMTGPHGFFVLDDHHPGDVIVAATGTGIAPILPMMAELAEMAELAQHPTPAPRHVHVYWGLRQQRDLFIPDEVAAACAGAGAHLSIHLSRPDETPPWPGPRGRIIAPVLAALPGLRDPTFYLVGNGTMIEELKRELVARGINRKKQIRTEAFFD